MPFNFDHIYPAYTFHRSNISYSTSIFFLIFIYLFLFIYIYLELVLLLYSWVWSLLWSVIRMGIGRGVHEGSPLTGDLFAVGKGAPSTLTTFPFHCFLLLCLQPWLIFKGPWPNLVLWSTEHDPKFGRSVAIVKLLKTHFEGSATYRKLALDNEERCNIGVICCRRVSPLSPSTGNIGFFSSIWWRRRIILWPCFVFLRTSSVWKVSSLFVQLGSHFAFLFVVGTLWAIWW